MSGPRKARFTSTKPSSHSRWLRYHLLPLSMCPPEFLGHGLQLDGVPEDRVVAVPLDEVGAPHEGPVLGRPLVVIPRGEGDEVDGLLEGFPREHAVLAQPLDDL